MEILLHHAVFNELQRTCGYDYCFNQLFFIKGIFLKNIGIYTK